MVKVILDGTVLKTLPSGIDELIIQKKRHDLYFGFLDTGIGYLDVNKELSFYDTISKEIIETNFLLQSIDAYTTIEIFVNDTQIFIGSLDYTTYKKIENKYISCTLKPEKEIDLFFSNDTKKNQILPTKTLYLKPKIFGEKSHSINPEISYINKAFLAEALLKITIPFKKEEKSINGIQDITSVFSSESIFINSYQFSTFSFQGSISFSIKTDRQVIGKFYIEHVSGIASNKILISNFLATPTNQSFIFIFDQEFTLLTNDSVCLFFEIDALNTCTIQFDTERSFVSIVQIKEKEGSYISFIDSSELFTNLIQEIYSSFSFSSTFLETTKIGITNGKNIRGFSNAPIQISIKELFENLDSLFIVGLERFGTLFCLEKREQLLEKERIYLNFNVQQTTIQEETFFSQFLVGYAEGQNQTIGGINEIHTQRTYETGFLSVSEIIDKTCQFVASSSIIEEGKTNNKEIDWDFDDKLFIILYHETKNGYEPIYNENVLAYEGIIDISGQLNISIRPEAIANRIKEWYPYKKITKIAGTGNHTATIQEIETITTETHFLKGLQVVSYLNYSDDLKGIVVNQETKEKYFVSERQIKIKDENAFIDETTLVKINAN